MSKTKKPSIDKEASLFLLAIFAVIVGMYTFFLLSYFERGLDTAARTILLAEARSYAKILQNNPEAPLPNSYQLKAYDRWDKLPDALQQNFTQQQAHLSFDYVDVGIDGKDEKGLAMLIFDIGKQRIYLTYTLIYDDFTEVDKKHFYANMDDAPPLAIGSLILIIVANFLISRRFTQDTKQLYQWSGTVNIKNYQDPLPNFRYKETQELAESLQQALQRVAKLVEREHYFLRHASHELRTPIAVTQAGLELLEKQGLPDVFKMTLTRLQRANKNMQKLIETLLWSSRESSPSIISQDTLITQRLNETVNDLRYLLEGKQVSITQIAPEPNTTIHLPETPWLIVISNLIRNAFQYTQAGQIDVQLTHQSFIIHNKNDKPDQAFRNEQSFGLGLMLVRELCNRLKWQLTIKTDAYGVHAKVDYMI